MIAIHFATVFGLFELKTARILSIKSQIIERPTLGVYRLGLRELAFQVSQQYFAIVHVKMYVLKLFVAFRLKKRMIWSDSLPTTAIDGVKVSDCQTSGR